MSSGPFHLDGLAGENLFLDWQSQSLGPVPLVNRELCMSIKKFRPVLVAAVCFALSSAPVMFVPASVHAAEKQEAVSVKVGKPLKEAIDAAQAKKFDDALNKLRDAEAIADKTAFDQFKINQTYQWIYISQKKYAEAAAVTEKLLDSGMLTPAEVETSTKQVFQMYLQVKNYPKAQDALQRWLKSHPNDSEMQANLGLLQFQTGQTKQAAETLNAVVNSTERSGSVPKEDWLQALFKISYTNAGNTMDKSSLSVVEKLVKYYPKEAYWQALLAGLRGQLTNDTARFELYRLMLSVGTLKDASDYVEMAQLANNFGFPGEALAVLDAGYAKNILGTGADKDRHDRLRANFQKAAAADKAALPTLEKNAAKSASGQEDASLGEDYIGYGMYQESIAALERGLGKGGIKRPDQAQIALGVAYLRAGQPDKARAAFKQVTGESDLARIANLWALHALAKK